MKTLSIILLTLSLVFPVSPAFAGDLEFPFTLDGPGTYNLEIPEDDSWKIFNEESWTKQQLEFAKLKLIIEEKDKIQEIEINYLKEANILKVQNLNDIHEIENNYFKDKIGILETNLKKERGKGSFLGIPTNYMSFVLGSVITAWIASGVK